MQASHSRSGVFEGCKYRYKLQYIDQIKVIPSTEPDNALFLGTAMHTGIEKDAETAVKEYFFSYPIIDDKHINESIKLEYLIPRVKAMLPKGMHEVKVETPDFIAYLDLLVPVGIEEGIEYFDLYDFKYSNNIKNYNDSGQLHIYKHFFEQQNPGKRIRNMYWVFIPKVQIRQKIGEGLHQFRKRIMHELEKSEIKIIPVEFDYTKVVEFTLKIKHMLECTDFEQERSYLCNWCQYQKYCEKGWEYMILPKNERRKIEALSKKVLWVYGVPFSGKTCLANDFPDPLMLNTDGNIKFIDSPFIPIKDIITQEGRITKRKLAWEVFKETVAELEKKDNDFKTIVVDLLEDLYEHCRVYICDQMGISHESDDSFRAWDKVRSEFLNTLKRLINLDYENIILISHEDTTKDITKKGGDKVTSIKPNIADKVAVKVAGMVDIVARVIADDSIRTLNFKSNEVIFGGGRLNVKANAIPLDFDELMKVYADANEGAAAKAKTETGTKKGRSKGNQVQTPPTAPPDDPSEPPTADGAAVEPVNTDNASSEPEDQNTPPAETTETKVESKVETTPEPVKRTRKKRE